MSLSGLSRADRLLASIVLVTAALVALVTWLVLPPEKTGGLVRRPSTFFNVGYGTKAAYLVLERLEYPAARLRRPIRRETLEGIGVLFVLNPSVGLERYEMADVEDWVRQGHALVVVPGGSPSGRRATGDAGRGGTFFDEWFDVEKPIDDGDPSLGTRRGHPADADRPATRSNADAEVNASEPLCAGIHRLAAGSDARFARSPLRGPLAKMSPRILWKDNLGPLGLRLDLGAGTIVALADAHPLTNLGISEDDNGLLLGNIVRELSRRSPGKVAFDEYHLGFAQRDWSAVAMTKMMLAGPWRWALGQAILVAALALYAGAVRFGSPRDVSRTPRRQHREFVQAAGRLLDEAGATSLAAQTLYRHYRDRLCRALRLEPEADDERLGQSLRDRSGRDAAAAWAEARSALSRRVTRRELLVATQGLHHVGEGLDHGP